MLCEREQVAGSHAVGVTRVDFLDYPDGVLEYSLPVRRDIARVIRDFRPDAVVVGSWHVECVEAHAEYLARIPGHPPARMMITGITALQGPALGVANAVLFVRGISTPHR